jgi:hypothetical protein
LSEYAISGLGQGVFGPSGATQVDQSALISATNKFFGNYYSLASDSKFLPGDDLVFANLANKGFFNLGISNNYVVGPIDGSSQILTASTDRSNRTIIVGGQGDDIIRGTSRGDDLIDGGGGNNTIYAGSGKQIIFGGSYGTNVIYGNPDQQKSVTDILVGGPGGTNPGNQPGQTAPDASPASDPSKANYTITAGSGKSIMIGGKGVNTFNVKHYDSGSGAVEPAVNIIWGGGGASTYNFTGTAFISVFYMDDPSVGKITKLTQDELASISDTYLGDTIIINPGPEDKITLNGNPLSSASYQPQGRSDVYWVDFYNPNYGKTDDPRSHYFRYGSAGLNSYGPVGTIWPDGTEVLGYTHQGYYDFFGFADSNQGTQLLYRPGDTFVHSPNKIDVYDLGSSPGVSPSDSFHDFIEIGNFTLGGFGINLTGNGPVLVYHGDWSGSEEGSNAADAGFLAYNEKKYINVKMSEGDGTTIQSGPGKSILVSGGQNVDYVINAGAAQVTINNHNDKGIGGEGIVTLDSSFDSSDVTVNGKGDDLLISDVRAGLQVSILGSLTSPANRIAAVNFADGTTWTYSQLIAMATTGSPTNRDLYGDTDGNVLDSKGYAYYAAGGGGGDTFIYNTGYGDLYIDETDPNLSASNVLAFGDGIGPASVTVSGDTFGNLSLLLGNGDAVTLEQALANAGQVIHGVQRVTFADGTAWTYSDLLAASVTGTPTNTSIFGDAGANILDSKGYATYAQGNGGGDTFVFNAGYGQLEISGDSAATLRLGAGITAAALGVATDQSGNILLTDGITRDRIKIDAVLDVGGASYVPGIARAQFADGTILTRQQLLGMAVQGTLPVLVPAISGAVPGQAASDAAPILPFATVAITGQDTRLTETARITLTDAAGQATDANGLLTGAGLSRAGTGSYALSAASAAALTAALEQLSFTDWRCKLASPSRSRTARTHRRPARPPPSPRRQPTPRP